jgi:glycosyltransferase involved in cell wall biosynthesis
MFDVSVIICTHDPREDYLRSVLEALKAQTLPKAKWELILVDNFSIKPPDGRFNLSWHPNHLIIRNEQSGQTSARMNGIEKSKGELLIFLDDDNTLKPNYLEASLKVASENPKFGSWGGSSIPKYEIEPPENLRPWLPNELRINQLTTSLWTFGRKNNEAVPSGAGMVVRRRHADYYRELVLNDPIRRAFDHNGIMLGACKAWDMALCGYELGLQTGRFPELELTHLIPAEQLTLRYIEQTNEDYAYSNTVLDFILNSGKGFSPKIPLRGVRAIIVKMLKFVESGRVERRIQQAQEKGRLRGRTRHGSLGDLFGCLKSQG